MLETPVIIQLVETVGRSRLNTSKALEEYDPMQHKVHSIKHRPKKKIVNTETNSQGKKVKTTKFEDVNRISIPLQKLIVNRRVAFMNVGETVISSNPKTDAEERLLGMVKKMGEDNKMRYRENEIARRMMCELEVAKLWYSEKVDRGYWGELAPNGVARMKMKVLSPELGDELFPVFNASGDLVYFGRKYKETIDLTSYPIESLTSDLLMAWNKESIRFDVYVKEGVHQFIQTDAGWLQMPFKAYSYGKIPIIYYRQNLTPWSDVQPIIERLEVLLSNFADTDDYNGAPILVGKGNITGMSERGERGKTFKIEGDAEALKASDLKYVTWEQAPSAIKLEIDTLVDFIYTCTQTPNISFKEMKGLGASGIAIDRALIDAHLAARAVIDDVYGECTQRDINFRKSAAIAIDNSLEKAKDMDITFEIPRFRINDLGETITNYSKAIEGGLLSRETAISQSGLVDDAAEELQRIKKESETVPVNPSKPVVEGELIEE